MKPNEIRGQLVAEALAACPSLTQRTPARERLWNALLQTICTKGLSLVVPHGSKTEIAITPEHASIGVLAAWDWITKNEREARSMKPKALYVRLRGVATRGSSGSARAVQADALHGLTGVEPGQAVDFTSFDILEEAS